jgi:DNA-binding CsgD family transcriptional regulator
VAAAGSPSFVHACPLGIKPPVHAAAPTVRVGVVELVADEPAFSESLNGDVAWRTTPADLLRVMNQTPVDAIVFRVQVDDRDQLVESIDHARAMRPLTKLLIAASANTEIVVAEINSVFRRPGWRPGASVLSAREKQVLEQMRMGRTNREIASFLGIAHSTANRHVENILRKLAVRNRTQAVAEAAALAYQAEPDGAQGRGGAVS